MAIETISGRRQFPFTIEQIVNIFGEIGPLVAMFLVNGIYGIAAGTWALIATTVISLVVTLWVLGRPPIMPFFAGAVSVTFGAKVDSESVFGDVRSRWQKLKAKAEAADPKSRDLPLGVLSEELLNNREVVELRKEVTMKVRSLVLEVRRSRGLPDEDPKEGLVETWLEEGPKPEGHMKDDSWVRDI